MWNRCQCSNYSKWSQYLIASVENKKRGNQVKASINWRIGYRCTNIAMGHDLPFCNKRY